MAKRGYRAQEALLLHTVYETLIYPIREEIGEDMGEFMDDATILCMAFGMHEQREIVRRRVLRHTRVEGLWWGEEIKTLASRALFVDLRHNGTPWMYIRHDPREKEIIDIEVRCPSSKGPDWFTCTITDKEYKRLDAFLGPIETICIRSAHKEDDHDDTDLAQIAARFLG